MTPRWPRARPIWIDGVEDAPKTILIDALLQNLLADGARHGVAHRGLIASLASAKHVHRSTPKTLKIPQLLNHINLGMDGIVGITWTERTRTELVHSRRKHLVTLCKNSNVPICLCQVKTVVRRNKLPKRVD